VSRFSGTARFLLLLLCARPFGLQAGEALEWSGFALVRGSGGNTDRALEQDRLAAQLQLGIDWVSSPRLLAHLHLLARNDDGDGTQRGSVGVVEGYVEGSFHPRNERLRLRAGAMFLPTSRENVDALWENPYAISSSALNSWLGEELRPIGIDAMYTRRGAFAGATLFRGNDTFGAVPPVRGWRLDDDWTLLGEHVPVDDVAFTSVSAETDGRLGWSARGGWNGANLTVQVTHVDNRSDGLAYGDLVNWGTRFDIIGMEYSVRDWTLAGEAGWGPTFVVDADGRYVSDLRAGYVLASRRWARSRATIRVDAFSNSDLKLDHAVTLAYFWSPRGKVRLGAEVTSMGSDRRALVEARYHFSGH
jgi:hypothetical protein